jgi:hypothetical protein
MLLSRQLLSGLQNIIIDIKSGSHASDDRASKEGGKDISPRRSNWGYNKGQPFIYDFLARNSNRER